MEAVLNVKDVPDRLVKAVVADYERGLTAEIMKYPWQSETCIGAWHYLRPLYDKPGEYGGYLPSRDVIHWLIDTVSKNGTFILNVPGRPDGTIDSKEIAVLDGITSWMEVNGEAIYETRPWKISGEGPNMVKAGSFQGESVNKLGEKNIRFTRNKANSIIYAIVLGWPTKPIAVQSLGLSAGTRPGKIMRVERYVRLVGWIAIRPSEKPIPVYTKWSSQKLPSAKRETCQCSSPAEKSVRINAHLVSSGQLKWIQLVIPNLYAPGDRSRFPQGLQRSAN